MLTCKECGKEFKHLGSHLWHAHKILARDYKMLYQLDVNHSLITDTIKEKLRNQVKKYKTWKENFKGSVKYQFKKGAENKKPYYSEETKNRLKAQSKDLLNKPSEPCPVCNIKFNNLAVHLKQKHGLKYI
jgi:hypothetical protein